MLCSPPHAQTSPSDGYLRQKVAVLVYMHPSGERPVQADWIVAREIRALEAFVWRHSGERLCIEAVRIQPARGLREEEFLYRGTRWGYQPRLSPEIRSDLRLGGSSRSQFGGLLVVYEPLPAMQTGMAGSTYGPKGFSTIPLTEFTFREAGRRYPLHLILTHELLHQLERAFSDATGEPYLISPDEADLSTVLRRNASGSAIDWRLLSPDVGLWIPR